MIKSKRARYNDGVVSICEESALRRMRGTDVSTRYGLVTLASAPYCSMLMREYDAALLESDSIGEYRKIKMRRCPIIDACSVCAIGDRAYEVSRVEHDGGDTYVILKSIQVDGTLTYIEPDGTRDSVGNLAESAGKRTDVYPLAVSIASDADNQAPHFAPVPTLKATVRKCDVPYDAETHVVRNGLTYRINSVTIEGDTATVESRADEWEAL